MICQCRLATLRTFLTGLAQVHKIEAFPASTQLFANAKPSAYPSRTQTRGVHTAKPAASRTPSQRPSRADKEGQKANDGDGPEAGVQADPRPQKMRWRNLAPEDLQAKIEQREATKKNFPRPKLAAETAARSQSTRPAARRSSDPGAPVADEPTATTSPKTRKNRNQSPEMIEGMSDLQPGRKLESWQIQKARLKEKFPEGWKPRKRLSPDAMAGLRALNAQYPDVYTTEALSKEFQISAEAVRRILRSKWQPSEDEEGERQERWHRRGSQIWETKAALGVKPPRKWREEGIQRDPAYHERRQARIQRDQEWEEEEIRKYKEYRELQKAASKVV